jgi:hypothetical protein
LDAQKNEVHYYDQPQSAPSLLENKQLKTQSLQIALLDTNGAPLAMTKMTQDPATSI